MATPPQYSLLLADEVSRPGVTITASSEDPSFPVEALKRSGLFDEFRSAAAGVLDLVVDFGASVDLDAVGLVATNGQDADQLQVDVDDSPTFATSTTFGPQPLFPPSTTTDVVHAPAFGRHAVLVLPDRTTGRYLRVRWFGAGNPDGHQRAGVLSAGRLTRPFVTWAPGAQQAAVIAGPEAFERTARAQTFEWERVKEEEKASLANAARRAGKTGRFLAIPRPNESQTWRDEVLWARFDSMLSFSEIVRGTYRATVSIQEVLR